MLTIIKEHVLILSLKGGGGSKRIQKIPNPNLQSAPVTVGLIFDA